MTLQPNCQSHSFCYSCVFRAITVCTLTLAILISSPESMAADLVKITEDNRPEVGGKEVDFIDGDYLLKNDRIVAVIATPKSGRDANMTVRRVGGCLIDLTRVEKMSDQLSAFYPTAQQFRFEDPSKVSIVSSSSEEVVWSCESSASEVDDSSRATLQYRLADGADFVEVTITVQGETIENAKTACAVRADRTFKFGVDQTDDTSFGWLVDRFFQQAYGIVPVGELASPPKWDDDRRRKLSFAFSEQDDKNPQTKQWRMKVYPAASVVDLAGIVQGAALQSFQIDDAVGDHARIKLSVAPKNGSGSQHAWLKKHREHHVPGDGKVGLHLPRGAYTVIASAIGHVDASSNIEVADVPASHSLRLGKAGVVQATVVDQDSRPIPAKLTFYGVDGTKDPDFGPDSADGSVMNCVYTVDGTTTRSLPQGKYDLVISHGPEFDAEVKQIDVSMGSTTQIEATLDHVVQTEGWVSAELHSHSSPSGDNTSSQRGRVENLVCENLEFAPCTEHQRIESYDDHLQGLNAQSLMSTCSGMELTGGPLPLNHQNVFPLEWKPKQQNGGGPTVELDPILQIKKIAMWDNNSEKVVQINHPNLHQMARDKDDDGVDDGGFAGMFEYADVIEVHPPQAIFEDPATLDDKDFRKNRILQWVRLLSEGHRLPGVVNTDAHYNHHGSGWLRNWVRSSTDEPSKIDHNEMTKNLEAGRVIMSTGPFMTVQLHAAGLEQPAEIGDTVTLAGDDVELAVKIQCSNWLDINRVEVFVNGSIVPDLSRTRRTHPDAFADGVVKFDQRLATEVSESSFIIVAAIGEQLSLGRVMGEQYGKRPPVVISNPIYVNR